MNGSSRVLRRATPDDLDAIVRIWHSGWRDAHRRRVPPVLYRFRTLESYPPRVRERLRSTWVAVIGGAVVGFVVVIDNEVEQLYVSDDGRGSGTGAALLGQGERVIAEGGHDRAWLAVATGNTEAQGFYERVGWQDTGGIDYQAEAGNSTTSVSCRRYEKWVAR